VFSYFAVALNQYQILQAMKIYILTLLVALFLPIASQAQIVNGDFEDLNDTLAADWYMDDFGSGLKISYVQSGTYALAVWNWYYYGKGFVVNGETQASQFGQMQGSGTPSTEKALRLTGYYYYDTTGTDTNIDSALITVSYRLWDATNSKYDTVAFGITYLLPTAGSSPVAFSVPIVDLAPSVDPDTVLIYIQSSLNGFCDASGSGNCLYLYVDDLKLENTTGVVDVMGQFSQLQLHPNPTSNIVTIKAANDDTECHLYHISGALVHTATLSQGDNHIDVSTYPAGMYVVETSEQGKVLGREKLVKQ
jgi:hypothetical protein